jgi:hypothetical protein
LDTGQGRNYTPCNGALRPAGSSLQEADDSREVPFASIIQWQLRFPCVSFANYPFNAGLRVCSKRFFIKAGMADILSETLRGAIQHIFLLNNSCSHLEMLPSMFCDLLAWDETILIPVSFYKPTILPEYVSLSA